MLSVLTNSRPTCTPSDTYIYFKKTSYINCRNLCQ